MRGSWQLELAYLEDLVRGNGRMRIGDEVTGGHGSSATTSERSRLRTQYQYSQSGGKTLLRPPGSTRFHRYCSMRQHNKKDHVSKMSRYCVYVASILVCISCSNLHIRVVRLSGASSGVRTPPL